MVQTELSQLNRECDSWIDALRRHRSDLSDSRQKLQAVVAQPISKSALPQVEHYDNQFDIQLNNISSLKHAIKDHEKQAAWAVNHLDGLQAGDTLWASHENLHDQYQSLEHTISELKQEFDSFVRSLS